MQPNRTMPLWVKSGHWGTSEQCPLYPQKRTLELTRVMSALCQKQTHASQQRASSFDNIVGALPEEQRHVEAERRRGLEIDRQLELVRGLDRKLARPRALEDAIDISRCLPIRIELVNSVGQ